MKADHIPSVEDHLVRDIVRGIADAELSASTLAAEGGGHILGRVLTGLRESVAVARVRAEDLVFATDLSLDWATAPEEPEVDPYEGWLDYGIQIDGVEVNVRTSPEDAERLVAFLGKAEAERDLGQELKRAQLELVKAKLADRKTIKPETLIVGETAVYASVWNGSIVLEAHRVSVEDHAAKGDRGPTGYHGPVGVKGAPGD